mmetsp:Transcript_81987/g.171610  ORF Transcript_81987/g.171610 Transcript_81987/m.171610 type:complete len:274 (+) Transcript_81987:348-1169(+)
MFTANCVSPPGEERMTNRPPCPRNCILLSTSFPTQSITTSTPLPAVWSKTAFTTSSVWLVSMTASANGTSTERLTRPIVLVSADRHLAMFSAAFATKPLAPTVSTVSPGCNWAFLRAVAAVTKGTPKHPASRSLKVVGFSRTPSAETRVYLAMAPSEMYPRSLPPVPKTTRPSKFGGPTTTLPQKSLPTMTPVFAKGKAPCVSLKSDGLTPAAKTSMRTWPSGTAGIGCTLSSSASFSSMPAPIAARTSAGASAGKPSGTVNAPEDDMFFVHR